MFVTFTRHAILRISAAAIGRAEIDRILASGDIIERYPDDEPYPSVLMVGGSAHPCGGRPQHGGGRDHHHHHHGVPTRFRAVGPGVPSETEAHIMICVYCKTGDPTSGRTTVTFDREGVTIVIRNVPARICPQCGEQYFDADTTDRLLEMAGEATRAGVSVGIQEYAAAAPHG